MSLLDLNAFFFFFLLFRLLFVSRSAPFTTGFIFVFGLVVVVSLSPNPERKEAATSKPVKAASMASNSRARSNASPNPVTAAAPAAAHDVVFSPNPLPPQSLSSPPPSLSERDSRLASSTAPTQLLRRGTSSTSTTPVDKINGRFLLYNSAGHLVGAREPGDPWGVLVSEHVTLNCTYDHRTVRVGRDDDCDAVMKHPLVSTTHFTISLELEPYEPLKSSGDGNAQGMGASSSSGGGGFTLQNSDSRAASRWPRQPPSHNTMSASEREEDEEASVSALTTRVGSPATFPLSPRDVGLPGWRVRRVLLADCSANGTYINDELVGRGRYRELHSGNDINIVRVPEAATAASSSLTASALPCAVAQDSDVDSDQDDEDESRERSFIRQSRRALRELKRKHPTASTASTTAGATSTPTAVARQPRRRRAREGVDDSRDEADGTGEASFSRSTKEDLDKTQMFTALLSTLSTKYTYLERFCFHLYNAEEPLSHGVEGAAVDGDALDEVDHTTPATQQASSRAVSRAETELAKKENEENAEATRRSRRSFRPSAQQRDGVSIQPLSPTSSEEHSEHVSASPAETAPVLHQRSVRFIDTVEAERTGSDLCTGNVDSGSLVDSENSALSHSNAATAAVDSSSSVTELSSLSQATKRGGALTSSTGGAPRHLTARQEQVVSTLVTPLSLLRPRPSIHTSFIVPITLSEQEGSTTSSAVTTTSHTVNVPPPPLSTAVTRFHESLSISPAVQRKAAAEQRADIRRMRDHRLLAHSHNSPSDQHQGNVAVAAAGGGGAFGGVLKDVPVDTPIRYAVLPLRHLQWGGRIGSGASGEVYMGIDVSTATAVAIKVLKGGSLFPPATTGTAAEEEDEETLPPSAMAAARDGKGRGGCESAGLLQSPTIRPDDNTLLSLSDVSLGNTPNTSRSTSSASASAISDSTVSASTAPANKGSPRERQIAVAGEEEEEEEAESLPASVATTPRTSASSSTASATTPTECNRRPQSFALAGSAAVSLVRTSQHPTTPRQQPPPQQQHQQQQHQQQHRSAPRPSAPPIIRKHFREIVFLTTLQHHRIVRFLGFQFNAEGRLCLLMEYVAGGTLQTLIRNFGAFEENVIRLYTLQILEGLEYLARKGVVHGDLKSANILVSEQGSVKLTDFGTSRFVRECASDELAAQGRTAFAAASPSEHHSRASSAHRSSTSRHLQHQQQESRCLPDHDSSWQSDGDSALCSEHGVNETTAPHHIRSPPCHAEEDEAEVDRAREQRTRCPSADREEVDSEDQKAEGEEEEGSGDYSDVSDEPSNDTSQQRVLCGTPLYMSPELIRTQEPSFASDVWALGCVVYEMATGGVLPWRPIHSSNASAVIWYIGRRRSASEGPSLDDVYAERERLNHAAMLRRNGMGSDGAHASVVEEDSEDGDNDGSMRMDGWAVTPSPMLIDLLQCTLNMNAADRPSAAELLQHPFIRGESSLAALEKWHATVAAKHHALLATPTPKLIKGGSLSSRVKSSDDDNDDDDDSDRKSGNAKVHGQSEEEEEEAHPNEDEGVKSTRQRNRRSSASRHSTGSPFETGVIITSVNANHNSTSGLVPSVEPPQGTQPRQARGPAMPSREEGVVEEKEVAQRANKKSSTAATRSTPTPPSPMTRAVRCQNNDNELERKPQRRGRTPSKTPSPSPAPLGDSWEDVRTPSAIPVGSALQQPQPTADEQQEQQQQQQQQRSPVLFAQPHPYQAQHSAKTNTDTSSVLGEGNLDSQPLISEPPRPIDVGGTRTHFWKERNRRDNVLPVGSTSEPTTQVPPLLSPVALSTTATPQPLTVLSGGAGSNSSNRNYNLPVPSTSQPFSSTAPPFNVPLPRSQTQGSSSVMVQRYPQQQQQQQQQCFSKAASQPYGTYLHSNIAAHQLFLRKEELARQSTSLATSQPLSRQTRGRQRTEASLPTYDAATHQHPQQQRSVLGSSRQYSYHNPQLNTQTMEMYVPTKFASQPPPSGVSVRYGQRSSKRKTRMGGVAANQNQASQLAQQPASQSPRGPGPRSGPVLGSSGSMNNNITSNTGSAPQRQQQQQQSHASFMPPQLRSSWKPGELTLEMDNMTLSSPRTNALPASASAYTGAVPFASQQQQQQLRGSHPNNNNMGSAIILTPSQQQIQQGRASPLFSCGSSNVASNNPGSPLDFAPKNTTSVLGEGSRPRRFLLSCSRGGRRYRHQRRQNGVATAAARKARPLPRSDADGSTPRRSSIGSLRQRRRGKQRRSDNSRHAFGQRGDAGGGAVADSTLLQQANAENKSAVLPSPPPPPSQLQQQQQAEPKATPDKRRRATRSRSLLRGRNVAKREPRERSKKGQ